MKKKIVLLIVFVANIIIAQEKQQPKVGVVLSGGGAKGFAHIAVLKELEKAGVQIDYIGGTSMGAIVGGLYSAGYKATQIESLIKKLDFTALLKDDIPRRQKTYFEKTYLEKHAISLPVKKGIIGVPLGLSKGQNVLNLFTELLAPVDEINDFSKLPIPFYCIATNIENGDEVIFEKGSLPLAIRASGSFPSLLNPVKIDGHLLIDGGVVNNFPVDIMKKKGMDIIIGVNVQGELLKRKELSSATSILSQIVNFQMYRKSDEQINDADVYIRPKVTEYNVVSFDKSDEIINAGYRATKPFEHVFDSIAKLQEKKRKTKQLTIKQKRFLVDRIIIKGNKNYTKKYILNKLQLKEGDSTSYHEISTKINTLSSTQNFDRIDYSFEKSFKGKKLELLLKESTTTSFLRLGLHYDLLYKSGILLNYNHKKLLFRNDEISLNIVVGDNLRYNLDYFLDDGNFGYGIGSKFSFFSTNTLSNSNVKNIYKTTVDYRFFTNKIYAQTTLDKKFAFGFGFEHKKIKISTDTFLTNNKKTIFENSNYLIGMSFLRLDTFDKPQFPTHGVLIDLNFKWYLWSDRNNTQQNFFKGNDSFTQFSQIDGRISVATSPLKNLTFQYTSEAGITLSKENSGVFDYRLGGYNQNFVNSFFPMYGYDVAALTDQSFLRSEFNFRYQIFSKNYVNFIANYARTEENILNKLELFKNIKSGYAIGYGLETFLGPIEIKYSWSPNNKENYWLFNLGFWF